MYFPIGWPKVINTPELGQSSIKQIACNRDRILFAILTDDSISIWFCKPCVPIVFHRRSPESLKKLGTNILVEWKPDSSMLVIASSEGHLLFYNVGVIADQKGLYIQTDSPHANLRRDSAELFIKEIIPPLHLSLGQEVMVWDGQITSMVCITMTELMVATSRAHVLRYRWDATQNRDYCLDLRRTPFCINQQVSKAIPIVEENTYIIDIEYSPLIGGFAITLNDGRAAFLTALSLRFDPNSVQGIWAVGVEDAVCGSVNHKYRLLSWGRASGECVVYSVDDGSSASAGGLALSHVCQVSSKHWPGEPGPVQRLCWSPDGCALVCTWAHGGLAVWSTFGTLLTCSLAWDYGLHTDLALRNPIHVSSIDWALEGYQLWMVHHQHTLLQMDFVKSALTVNPCMSQQSHLYLQGDERLYVNVCDTLLRSNSTVEGAGAGAEVGGMRLGEGRQWQVVAVPATYAATNTPVRYSAIDQAAQHVAVAGRTGLAHYSMQQRRWKLFGNETQEKDFIVSGGLVWWREYLVCGCYSILDNGDEVRLYPRDTKLDNKYTKLVHVTAQVLLLNILQDQLVTFCSDAQVGIYRLKQLDAVGGVEVTKLQAVDISALCVHPACVTSITLTSLRTEPGRGRDTNSESLVLNVSGRLLMVQREQAALNGGVGGDGVGGVGGGGASGGGGLYTCAMPTVLASCVENVWVPAQRKQDKPHLTEALWLFCGAHGMRVWLPLFPRDGDKSHTFMSKRIMLPFHLKIYPLAILFEDAIILGAENDTVLYTSDSSSPFSLPFSVLERTSQVYLHQILRQLIRRNLGYHAWEIARSCMSLPYFPHSLELLLHEVLEEEATSKEPIPDAQLPSIIEFISEFPMYLETVVQCARKTEIALWPYLFSVAGKPKDLFQECMASKQLDTAASYLIILQNLETSSVSRQYATLLLDTALDQCKWELAKDLVRFLRAIDPNDVESPRTSFVMPAKFGLSQQTPPVSPNAEDLSVILGSVQVTRHRSYSTSVTPKLVSEPAPPLRATPSTATNTAPTIATNTESPVQLRKKSMPANTNTSATAEEFFIDVILQRHARKLLSSQRLVDLGYFAAYLDFHLVTWLVRERDRAARLDDFVAALKRLHRDFSWPHPTATATVTTPTHTPTTTTPTTKATNGGNESPPLEERFKTLQVDTLASHVGDSGYMSFPGGLPCTGLVTPVMSVTSRESARTLEAHHHHHHHHQCVESGSVSSSVWPDDVMVDVDVDVDADVRWSDVPAAEELAAASRGPARSQVQLRYLLQLFMEAGCLDWSLLISVLLTDAMAVLRTINAARSPHHSVHAVDRLHQGLHMLHQWVNTQCLGYVPFMMTIQNQTSVLAKILATKVQQQQQLERQQQEQQVQQAAAVTGTDQGRLRKASANYNDNNTNTLSHRDRRERVSSVSSSATEPTSGILYNSLVATSTASTDIPAAATVAEPTGCVIS